MPNGRSRTFEALNLGASEGSETRRGDEAEQHAEPLSGLADDGAAIEASSEVSLPPLLA